MRSFYEYYLRFARRAAKVEPKVEEDFRTQLQNAIATDDRKTILELARSWPELLIKEEGSYVPTAQMGTVSSQQTIVEVIKVYPDILDAKISYGRTLTHYAAM